MAIFGMNGLYSAGLYLAALYALYGQKNAGFKNNEEVQAIAAIAARKGVAGATKSGGRKAAIAVERLGANFGPVQPRLLSLFWSRFQ